TVRYNASVVSVLRLILLRHGETDSSRARRFTGSRDVELTALGQRQAEAAAAVVPAPIHAVYASPLERTRTTAEAIAKRHQLTVRLDPRVAEMRFGACEGLTR